jgi:hypothetical protein
MSKKIDRALYGPSWFEVFFGALLSVIIGVVLAAAYLITKPVVTAKELPKEKVAGVVYYLEGSKDSTKGRSWQAKRQRLLNGLSVAVSEDELNAAVTALNAPAPKKPGTKEEPAAEAKPTAIVPSAPNFRIREGEMQIGVPITINALELGLNLVVQARGSFEKQDERFVFTPATLLVGSCPVEKLPFFAGYVMRNIVGAQAVPEDLAAAWGRLTGVTIEGAQLKLDFP